MPRPCSYQRARTSRISLSLLSALRLVAFIFLTRTVYSQETSTTLCGTLTDYHLCPASFGGGCCPIGLVCGAEGDCGQNTAPPSPECMGHKGFYACAQSLGGDCCPYGYLCDTNSDVQCRLTLKLNEVTETLYGSGTAVSRTVILVGDSVTAADRIPPATSTDSTPKGSNSSGLSSPEIGGIVGGALGGFLLLLTGGLYLLIRNRRRRSAEKGGVGVADSSGKPELDGQGVQLVELGGEDTLAEMQETHREYELVGGYEAHGISELEGTPREQSLYTRNGSVGGAHD
ncbi:Fc.00g026910.m01.CDS01 [Cosmosporella sp. VM-42]